MGATVAPPQGQNTTAARAALNPDRMSAEDLRDHLQALNLRQEDAGRLFGVGTRTIRHWATAHIPVPRAVAVTLRIMRTLELRPLDWMPPVTDLDGEADPDVEQDGESAG